jgi:hypothetical protein
MNCKHEASVAPGPSTYLDESRRPPNTRVEESAPVFRLFAGEDDAVGRKECLPGRESSPLR